MFKDIVFYGFSLVLVLAALGVITARNPVHAALLLVLSFFTAAGIWMLLKAEFLAISLVLVYVGAVMVLFLFVVMMLDVNISKVREGFWRNSWLGMLVGVVMLLEMAFLLLGPAFDGIAPANATSAQPGYSNIKELGRLIYTDYAFPFELAALILLVAIVAAIALTLRGRKDAKSQDPAKQVLVRRSDRLRIIKMDASPSRAAVANRGGQTAQAPGGEGVK